MRTPNVQSIKFRQDEAVYLCGYGWLPPYEAKQVLKERIRRERERGARSRADLAAQVVPADEEKA